MGLANGMTSDNKERQRTLQQKKYPILRMQK